jgi:dUTP pyrophosphatase
METGISLQLPNGLEAQVRSRSGLASKGIFVINSPGTIDPDYRGEVLILLANFTTEPYFIRNGERIAQLVFSALTAHVLSYENEQELSPTLRGTSGFGSTRNYITVVK